jgi:HEAT repeat protein
MRRIARAAALAAVWTAFLAGTAVQVRAQERSTAPSERQADSLWRAARSALNDARYREAADYFRQAAQASKYQNEALYYRGLALYKLGGRDGYRASLGALEGYLANVPAGSAREDAEKLAMRVRGELARLGDPRAAERVRQDADRADRELKIYALQALLKADPDTGLALLHRTLTDRRPETVPLRQEAVFLLTMVDSGKGLDLALDVARNDPDPEVRARALEWLARSDDPRATSTLARALQSDDPELYQPAIFALARTGQEGEEALRTFLLREDTPTEARAMAAQVLSRYPSRENARFLMQVFDNAGQESPEMRDAILASLGAMAEEGVPLDTEWIMGLVRGGKEGPASVETRALALQVAARYGTVTSRDLAALYDDGDRQIKEIVLHLLAQRDDEVAFTKILEIARTETDPEMRQAAVMWLGRSGDPRAKQLLLEIVGS